MTDNGSCYKFHAFRDACVQLGLKHIRTTPYTPKINGNAERFIQTSLKESPSAQGYDSSDHRAVQLPASLHRYNWHRPTRRDKLPDAHQPSGLDGGNLLRLHS